LLLTFLVAGCAGTPHVDIREWLDEIVVGPAVEADNAVIHGIACGQHEDGDQASASPELGQKLKTVESIEASVSVWI